MSPVAIVTGGSRGIGRAVALEAARRGYDVALSFRSRKDEAQAVVDDIEAAGRRAAAVMVDLAEPADGTVIVDAARALGDVSLLVNNAGITNSCALDELTLEGFEEALAVNLTAPAWLSRLLAPDLRRSAGAIVNMGSTGGLTGSMHSLAYGASKAGVHGLTRTLARMLAPDVRVNAVCPGPIATDMLDALTPEQLDAVLSATPAARLGTPEEIATVVLDVAGWGYCTGQTIVVDGGRVMQ